DRRGPAGEARPRQRHRRRARGAVELPDEVAAEADRRRRGLRADRALHRAERKEDAEGGSVCVTRIRLRRRAWSGAAGLLGLAALVALVAVVRGEVTETDTEIFVTLGTALLTGASAIVALALLERHDWRPVALLTLVTAPLAFVAIAIVVWQD